MPVLDTAEIVPSTTPMTVMALAFAMWTGVVDAGKPRRTCSGSRQTCAPESTTAPGMLMLKPLPDEGMEMRMSRWRCTLKDAFTAAMRGASKGGGSVSSELCFR